MLNLYEYEYKGTALAELKGKKLVFRMSHKAKCEIEEIQKKQIENLADPDILKASLGFAKLEGKDLDDEEVVETVSKLAPSLVKLNTMNSDIEPEDFMYVLLHNHPEFRDISKDDWELILEDMEENVEYEELLTKFGGAKDKVFTLLKNLNKPHELTPPEDSKGTKKTLS